MRFEDMSKWIEYLLTSKREGRADWFREWKSHRTAQLVDIYPRSSLVGFQVPDAFSTMEEGISIIETLPFGVCSIGDIYPDEWSQREGFGFGRMHCKHGWACAFRREGHDRLVSRRWLDFAGPWRVIRRPGDLTVVQFHDLNLDADRAYEQATPGHRRMGISTVGGYLQVPYPWGSRTVEGLYVAERRTLEIVVPPGGKLEQMQMRDSGSIRSRTCFLTRATRTRICTSCGCVSLRCGLSTLRVSVAWI
ncbi:MAG: hypothetical protein E6J91_14195 [Deltaproteobacteria bacterium]|nr:MAG: hypothetical protein E6J91_14195 [Deltaproteobacteria bacterium]